MKIKHPETEEEINIYSARLTFVREKNGSIRPTVYVTILYNKNKKDVKNFPIPKDIDINDLNWRKKTPIAVYNRKGDDPNYHYTSGDMRISTGLGGRLEELVKKVCFGNSNKRKHVK